MAKDIVYIVETKNHKSQYMFEHYNFTIVAGGFSLIFPIHHRQFMGPVTFTKTVTCEVSDLDEKTIPHHIKSHD